MNVVQIPCRKDNYGGCRGGNVRYLVIHYTASPGDTAVNNGKYFAREYTGTSAHYFVDEETVVQSVPEDHIAWHCGGAVYRHALCRNQNSIGIEICTKKNEDGFYFAPRSVENAMALTRQLMETYSVPAENVLRHYDVTGKICPAPFVGQGEPQWEAFKGGIMMYKTLEEVPEWAQGTVRKLLDRQLLQGNGESLDLSHDLVRTLVILDRADVFGKDEEHVG